MFIDTHCHLDFAIFDQNRAEIIKNARRLEVNKIVVPGVTQDNWERVAALGKAYKNTLYSAFGLHPCFCDQHQDEHLEDLDKTLKVEKPIAVGEIGLDFFIDHYDAERQTYLFREQVKLAKQHKLPIIVHCRKAHDQCLKAIREIGFEEGGFIHAYSGSLQQAKRYLNYGFKLGVGGSATYERAQKIHRILRTLPLDSFVLETDSPDIPPSFARNEPNTPLNLPKIASLAAHYAGLSLSEFADQTTISACKILKINQ